MKRKTVNMKKYIESVETGERVYFARSRATGLIKIRRSKDVERRLRDSERASSERIELLATIPGGEELESALHDWFKGSRQKGEWHSPTQELLDFIASIRGEPVGGAETAPPTEPTPCTESNSNQGAVHPEVLADSRIQVPQGNDPKGKYPRRWLEDFRGYIGMNYGELQSLLNRCGEEVVVEAMHDYDRQVHKGTKLENPAAYFTRIVQNRAAEADMEECLAEFPEHERRQIGSEAWQALDRKGMMQSALNMRDEIVRIVRERTK